jgi:hypothetical protein
LTADTEAEARRLASEAKAAADKLRQDAENYARGRRSEADQYSEATRRQADDYATQHDAAARADADACRRQAVAEAEHLVREAMDHRTNILRELARRRDLACAQVRAVLDGRDLVVGALDQVRLVASEVIEGIDELSASPSDMVSLDPAIEGPGADRGAALTVRRGRQAAVVESADGRELNAAPAAVFDAEQDAAAVS